LDSRRATAAEVDAAKLRGHRDVRSGWRRDDERQGGNVTADARPAASPRPKAGTVGYLARLLLDNAVLDRHRRSNLAGEDFYTAVHQIALIFERSQAMRDAGATD
jgi:hypothetical protein